MGVVDQQGRPDSLAPVALEGIDEEAAAMNKGKGRMFIVLFVVAGLAGGGGGALLYGMDASAEYREAGAAVDAVKDEGFDRFWLCALEGAVLSDVKTTEDLVYQIERRSEGAGVRYARLVRDRCGEFLDAVETRLTALRVPEDVQGKVDSLRGRAAQLRDAWAGYIEYLTDPDSRHDEADAEKYLDDIAAGWQGYQKEHEALNTVLQRKLK
jgi:hypothetical protein